MDTERGWNIISLLWLDIMLLFLFVGLLPRCCTKEPEFINSYCIMKSMIPLNHYHERLVQLSVIRT